MLSSSCEWEEREKCEKIDSADIKLGDEGGEEEVLQPPEQEIPCSPWRGPQWSSLKEAAGNREHMQEPTLGWTCSPQRAGGLSGAAICQWPIWINLFLKDSNLWYITMLEQFLKICSQERSHTRSIHKGLHSMEETLCWSGGKARGGRSSTEKILCTVCNLRSLFSCSSQREKVKKLKLMLNLGRKGVRRNVFLVCFSSHYLTRLWISNKLNYSSPGRLLCPWQSLLSNSTVLISTHKFFYHIFFLLSREKHGWYLVTSRG